MNDETGSSGSRGRILPAVVLGVVLVAGAAVGGVALAQSAAGPSGETILENAHDQYESADTLTGVAEVTVSNATESRSATVEYAAARPDSARMAVTHNGTTVSMGTNGTVAWVSAPAVGVERAWNTETANDTVDSERSSWNATEACVAARSHADAFAANHTEGIESAMADAEAARPNATDSEEAERLVTNPQTLDCDAIAAEWVDAKDEMPSNRSEANVSVSRTGSTTIDGTEAYVVNVEPENESIDANTTVVVAKDDSRVLETRLTDGTNATVVRYDDQHFNVSMDDSTFAPPAVRTGAGTATYDDFDAAQSNTDDDLPALNADGYAFSEAVVTHAGDGTTVAQRYTEDATNTTLISTDSERVPYNALNGTNVTVNGHDATVATMEDRSVVAWTDDETTYALVTDGSGDATALAQSVLT